MLCERQATPKLLIRQAFSFPISPAFVSQLQHVSIPLKGGVLPFLITGICAFSLQMVLCGEDLQRAILLIMR